MYCGAVVRPVGLSQIALCLICNGKYTEAETLFFSQVQINTNDIYVCPTKNVHFVFSLRNFRLCSRYYSVNYGAWYVYKLLLVLLVLLAGYVSEPHYENR